MNLRPVRPFAGVEFLVALDDVEGDPIRDGIARGENVYPPQMLSLLRWIQPGMTVVDLGAHIGTFALAAAKVGARVIAFEALPSNFAVLSASRDANELALLEPVHSAIADRDGVLEFMGGGPWGHRLPEGSPPNERAVSVPATSLDAALAARGISRVQFVKIDVEGSELYALKGMRTLLSDDNGPAIFIEANALCLGDHGVKQSDLIAFLESYGYSCYEILDRLRPITPADFQYNCNTDYFALKGIMRDSAQTLVGDGVRIDEIVAGVRFNARHPSRDFRMHLVRALPDASLEIRTHPEIVATLRALLDDPDEAVRAGAAALLH